MTECLAPTLKNVLNFRECLWMHRWESLSVDCKGLLPVWRGLSGSRKLYGVCVPDYGHAVHFGQ